MCQSFELFAFLAASMFMLLRLVFSFVDRKQECTGDHLLQCEIMFGISALFNVISWVFCYKMQADLRWKKYKAIGADLDTVKMCVLVVVVCACALCRRNADGGQYGCVQVQGV